MGTSGTNDNLKVSEGDSLSAKRWNRVIDRLPENQSGTGTSVGTLRQAVVFGKAINDVELGEVRGLGDFYGDPNAPFDIGDGDIVDLALPVFPSTCHMLMVPRQPIKADEIGPCVYDGGVLVRFREGSTQPLGNYCFPDPLDPTYMKRSTSGYKISTVVSTDYSVASMGDVQQVWKFELLDNYTGGATAFCKLLTLRDEEFASSVEVHFLNCGTLAAGTIGYCVFADGEFHTIEICQGGGSGSVDNPRIRFRLQVGFKDTGEATAVVLNTYGTTTVSPGDVVTVCDTQKQFAHAIGSTDVSIPQSTVFPCGGSLGFAVETERVVGACTIEGICTDNVSAAVCAAASGTFEEYKTCAGGDLTPVKRWEVEQCSQTVNRMLVSVYRNSGTHSQPTGEDNEPEVTLYFQNAESVLSRYPNVDYDLGIEVNTDPAVPYAYKIKADNDGRFSAIQGSLVTIQAVPRRQRLEDGCNDSTPYAAQNYEPTRWQIEEVHSPLARWIRVTWQGSSNGWFNDIGFFKEGENPLSYFEDPLNDHIETVTGLEQECLTLEEPAWAFWDPNDQKYNVAITRSALYGTATSLEMVGKKTGEVGELLDFDGCDLDYKETKPWLVFGDGEGCDSETIDKKATANLVPVQNIYDVSRVGDYLHFSYNTIYVCKTDPGGVDTEYICCPDEQTGCCENYDGTYTPGVTQDYCENPPSGAPPGTYLGDGSDCPGAGCLVECSECSNGGASFELDGLSWSGTTTGSGANGHADGSTAVWTAGSNCCAQLSVTLKSDDLNVNDVVATAQVCIVQPTNCPFAMLELELSWSPATFDGVTLPTTLGAGTVSGCGGTYGYTGGCIVPDQPDPNTPSGTWDEADITVTDCTI